MKESATDPLSIPDAYQIGRELQTRRILLRQATKRLGRPNEHAVAALNALDTLEQWMILCDRVLVASSWEELIEGKPETGQHGTPSKYFNEGNDGAAVLNLNLFCSRIFEKPERPTRLPTEVTSGG